jgi:hypothetical protein
MACQTPRTIAARCLPKAARNSRMMTSARLEPTCGRWVISLRAESLWTAFLTRRRGLVESLSNIVCPHEVARPGWRNIASRPARRKLTGRRREGRPVASGLWTGMLPPLASARRRNDARRGLRPRRRLIDWLENHLAGWRCQAHANQCWDKPWREIKPPSPRAAPYIARASFATPAARRAFRTTA